MTFEEFGLSPEILQAIAAMGFETPTPVQVEVIPRLLKNRGDMVALAQTGTGKTAAFGLPILHMLKHDLRSPQALVLCPTRELCVQITRDLEAFAAHTQGVRVVAVYGGADIQNQLRALKRGVQIIVATPGRMLDILRRGRADLSGVERVILDEADEMLNMGFQEDLEAILAQTPDTAHSLLFSATMPRHVAAIARKHMRDPEEITVGHLNAGAETVSHECYVVHQRDRYATLKRIADYYPDVYGIVFCRTRQETQTVADWLIRDGYNADSLHGDLSQTQRDSVMKKFRSRALQLLVATDVAARGLDVTDLTHIINYNLPDELGSYTHRSGRTGRAGKTGVSIVIINMREKGKAHQIERMINTEFAYRTVPTGREICGAQLLNHIARMKSVELDPKQIDRHLPQIYEALEGMSWKEVIQRFVSLEFETLLKYYQGAEDVRPDTGDSRSPARDGHQRRERPSGKGQRAERSGARLSVNLGTADDLTPRKLTGWISRAGGQYVRIGRIEIMDRRTVFEVPVDEAAALAQALGNTSFDGRTVRVEAAGSDRPRKPSGGPPRGKAAAKGKAPSKGKHHPSKRKPRGR
ncbi:MAG: DEAD/DEAH box helicase [Verrucomicrobia bacterium]|nr:DEAD/DEAH box helicase [Verrucomicrobiota bacterium]MDA1087326.1 DEAD/DEAH box helicase [Verrucomicrobiota bacterium]